MEAIHALLQGRKENEVMLCRFNRATLRGLFRGAGYSDLDDKTARVAAALILERLTLNEGRSNDYYTDGPGSQGVDGHTAIPNNLPLLPRFFGRDDELKTIANALRPDRQVWGALIRGPGGWGKHLLQCEAL
jgi:hypothetical protein